MLETLKKIWSAKELRNSVFYIIALLVLFRVVAHIPLPGIDAAALRQYFQSNQILGLLNVFSGGTISNFSIVALGVAPYITASIIIQLLGMIFPAIEEIQKEGEQGKRKITTWTRWLTVPICVLQAFGLLAILKNSGPAANSVFAQGPLATAVAVITMSVGTLFLMWLGELISERKLGNGMSLLIFAGIIAGLPQLVQTTVSTFTRDDLFTLVLYVAIGLFTVISVVVMNEAQRKIPIAHARQIRAPGMLPGASNFLPLKVNMAGVIPIIFAISMLLFPPMVARFFVNAQTNFVADAANWIVRVFDNQQIHAVLYFLLVFGFTYFYTSIVFQPDKIAENLQKQGAFIPGIRPGKPTADYLNIVTNRLLLAGGLFLATLAVLPNILQQTTNVSNIAIGGTSFLIVVSVVIETVRQVESQLATQEYDRYSA